MRAGWLGQLKPARTAGYTEFLARLLCVDVSRRYGAEEALNDPWIRDSDWAESDVAEVAFLKGSCLTGMLLPRNGEADMTVAVWCSAQHYSKNGAALSWAAATFESAAKARAE